MAWSCFIFVASILLAVSRGGGPIVCDPLQQPLSHDKTMCCVWWAKGLRFRHMLGASDLFAFQHDLVACDEPWGLMLAIVFTHYSSVWDRSVHEPKAWCLPYLWDFYFVNIWYQCEEPYGFRGFKGDTWRAVEHNSGEWGGIPDSRRVPLHQAPLQCYKSITTSCEIYVVSSAF